MFEFEIQQWLAIAILAVVQGIAEFLPISSSGHVVILSELLNLRDESAELNVVLHLGTLFSILVFYRERIRALLSEDRLVLKWLVIGTIPAAAIGIIIKYYFDDVLENVLLAGSMLLVTACFLFILRQFNTGKKTYQKITIWDVLIVGIFQAFALLPGISRSGSTILAGVLLGQQRQSATTFSFLLAIPAILGAAALESIKIINDGSSTAIPLLLMGMVIAFIVGILALRWLVSWVEKGKLHWFTVWLIPVGVIVIIWQLSTASN